MVLETTLRTPTGAVTITDALALGPNNRGHELGKGAPHLLLRRATCTDGHVDLSFEYVPRPQYGLDDPLLEAVDGGVVATGSVDSVVLSSPLALTLDHERSVASGRFQLSHGESVGFALHQGPGRGHHSEGLEPVGDKHAARGHRVGMGVVVGAPPGLRRSVA